MTRADDQQNPLSVQYSARSGEVVRFAAHELARALMVMMGEVVKAEPVNWLAQGRLRLGPWPRERAATAPAAPSVASGASSARNEIVSGGDGFTLSREAIAAGSGAGAPMQKAALVLTGASERALLHGVYALLESLGARFPLVCSEGLPRGDGARLDSVESRTVAPAFSRRAISSDIMTWHYETPERLATHLEHDRAFITWMATRGLNAFSYIRHNIDSRLKVDELLPFFRERGILSEYGGHILQLLLPRDRFETNSEYFPARADGSRDSQGNLCVSNSTVMEIVREGALRYVKENPECAMLHVWGADVWEGAWCRCGQCSAISQQLQYLRVVNAIAEAIAMAHSGDLPVAYLAYHDTLEPDPVLRPLPNVWFEWAPRERCYSHAIDDPACEVNPRYLDSLKRHIDLFEGRGHIFEYYADAILFGGLGVATPATIARDLRAYRASGLAGISCLTFGAHSAIAYPVNLEAFARGTRSPDFEPEHLVADTAAERYPTCRGEMAEAYRAIARASLLILDNGGDVMRPRLKARGAHSRLHDLQQARAEITRAIEGADHIVASVGDRFARAERDTWHYSREVVTGIVAYIEAADERSPRRGNIAIKKIGDAINAMRMIAPEAGDTWAAYDLEWIGDIWLEALRRRFNDARTREKA